MTHGPIKAMYVDELGAKILPGADKSLARPGRKQTAPVKSVMGRGME